MELPSRRAVEDLADELRLGIPAEHLDVYYAATSGLLGSWAVVDGLYDREVAPTTPVRKWSEPAANPLGAGYVTTALPDGTVGPISPGFGYEVKISRK